MNFMFSRIIIAMGMMLAATSAAHADPISILILGFIGIAAPSAALVSITTFALSIAASIGLSYLAKALAPKPSMPDISSLPGGTTGKLQAGGAVPRSFIVGAARMTAGSLAYANTYSSSAAITAASSLSLTTAAAGNTPNAYLVQVIALSDIPVSALVSMFVGSAAATYTGVVSGFEGSPVTEFTVAGKEHLWVRFYDGTQFAADPQLVALFGTDPDRPYTSARVGTGICYAVVTTLVNNELFSGFPQCKFVLDGIKLYDRRYDTSVGGSGSQRWATPSTWALTSNLIVIAENILRGVSYGGSWVYGAQTVTETQIPFASWTAAASECDSAIDLAAGGTEPQFRAGGEIRFDVEPANTLEELFKACNGRLAEIGGTYKVRAGAPGSAVFSFTDGDILSTEQQTFDPFPSLGQTINAVTAKYISPAEGYVAKDAPPLYDATLETADGGRRQAVDVNYSFVTSGTQVQRLMRAERDTHRAMRSHALPMPPEAFVLEPLDVISWTSTRNGYSSKLFEITSAEDLPNLNMGLAIKEIDPNAYDWVAATDEAPIVDGTIVVTRPPAQPIVDWAAVPWTILSDGVQSRPGIKLSWNASTEDVDGVLFEIRLASSGEVVHRGATDGFSAGSIIISQNLLFSTAYQARGQYRPISAREVSWSSWLDITTFDIRTVVAALDDALNRHITTQLAETQSLLKKTQDLIASLSADQGAANWLDKRGTKTAITASFGSAYAAIISEETVRVAADAALASRTTTLETFVNDPTTGLSTRASASDVTTLQSLTGHATYGNVALGTRTTTLETSVNDPTTGLSTRASASDVTALESLTGDVTHGNLALATRALSVEANLNGPSSSATVTITIASPAVVSWTSHGLTAGRRVKFSTTGALPTGVTAGTDYYVIAAGLTASAFQFSATFGGSAVNTSGSQSGTHTAIAGDVASDLSDVSAKGQFRTIASAGDGGALALVDLEVSASVGASFTSAGIQLAAFVGLNGVAFSRVRLYGDSTEIGIPSVTGGDFVAPFQVGVVNGNQRISLVPSMIPDDAIEARMMGTGATHIISTIDVANIDDTIDNWYNSGNGRTVIDQDFITDAGGAALIHFKTKLYVISGSPGQTYLTTVTVNGDVLETFNSPVMASTGTRVPIHIPSVFVDSLPGGASNINIKVTASSNTGGSNHVGAEDIKAVIEEIRAPLVNALSTMASPSITYCTHANGGTSGSFSSVSIGSAVANRVVAVDLGWTSPTNQTPTMTIGGTPAKLASGTTRHWANLHTAMFYLRVPTGTTADIVVSIAGSDNDNIEIAVWKVVANNEAPFWNDGSVSSGGSIAMTKNGLLSGMVCAAFAYGDGAIAGFTGSWSGSDTLTEDIDAAAGDARTAGYSVALTEAGDFGVTLACSPEHPFVANIAVWQ